ncbi:sensor histidine kinase [Candidatus Halobonum tyrrellensis]|uniref:histidine kinase n=1 Tax=Candidatus Halobonum tyrrellensis G22 TaxID=1324957 RepID=V4HN39_9EURY|nr:ATP-binding protein [Candidatus Halobonum tyrrellensis]ESP89309.1 histidine kinase [Candidatus Halobonum tyrrellensis G22]
MITESTGAAGGSRGTSGTLGLALVGTAAAATFAFGVVHAAHEPIDDPVGALGVSFPFGLAAALACDTVRLRRSDLGPDGVLRVGKWTVGAGLLGGVLGGLVVFHQQQEAATLADPTYVACGGAAVGATAGFLVGAYDARRIATMRRLNAERDHTERLEQQLRVLNRVLRHDIRNDANVIEGYADMLDDRRVRSNDAVAAIRSRARNLAHAGENARLVEELLDTERLASERVDVAPLARSAADRVAAAYPGVRVDTAIPPSAPVVGSRLLSAAVVNLVENAVEHNDCDAPHVRVTVERDRETVVVSVADNGPGIPDEERRVLERGHETPLHHSSGLGLWLVNWVVEDCDGRVDIGENGPCGSVVRLRLPAAE